MGPIERVSRRHQRRAPKVRVLCAVVALATGFGDIASALADQSSFNAPLVWESTPVQPPTTVGPTTPQPPIPASEPSSPSPTTSSGPSIYDPLIASVANEFGLDAELLHAIVRTESDYDASAISSKGAVGLMQVMPATGRRFGFEDVRDPPANLSAGAAYLRWLLDRFGNDLELALAAYNAGERAVERYGSRIPPFPETRGYVATVIARYRGSPSGERRSETQLAQSAPLALGPILAEGKRQSTASLAPLTLLEKLGSLMLSAPPSTRVRRTRAPS